MCHPLWARALTAAQRPTDREPARPPAEVPGDEEPEKVPVLAGDG